jgi:hypothetical protein
VPKLLGTFPRECSLCDQEASDKEPSITASEMVLEEGEAYFDFVVQTAIIQVNESFNSQLARFTYKN